ncbi:hypothetical protein GCM10027174_45100 [Salinifilum aidingensis]
MQQLVDELEQAQREGVVLPSRVQHALAPAAAWDTETPEQVLARFRAAVASEEAAEGPERGA